MSATTPRPLLETRLAEALLNALSPCDLGDGIEVIHDDDEALEVEMECTLDEEHEDTDPACEVARLSSELADELSEDVGTHPFVRDSTPYERIELHVDVAAFRRATIEEARRFRRPRYRKTPGQQS